MMRVVRIEATSYNKGIYNDFTIWERRSSKLPENKGNATILDLPLLFLLVGLESRFAKYDRYNWRFHSFLDG